MEQVTHVKQDVTTERTPIICGQTRRLIARQDEQGLYLWCRGCQHEHFIPWEKTHTSELKRV